MPRLRIERVGHSPLIFDQDLVTLGRAPSNAVPLDDARVSSVHGEIVRRGGDFYYRDLGSTNGSLVRHRGGEVVVDGQKVREVRLADGAALLLGDRSRPVMLHVFHEAEASGRPAPSETVLSRRPVTTVGELGSHVLENPLASRQTLARLLQGLAELGGAASARELCERVASQALGLLSKQTFGTCFLLIEGALQRQSFVTPDPARAPVVEAGDVVRWCKDALDGQAAMALSARAALGARAGALEELACVPWPAAGGATGLLVAGREAGYSPFDLDVLSLLAHHAAIARERLDLLDRLAGANARLVRENRDLKSVVSRTTGSPRILGESPAWKRAMHQAELVARAGTTVLLLGETGTGKEVIARHLHGLSDRASGPFAAVNCTALAETLLESELFGHVRGAFTGAERDKEGLFRGADRGTLFLDEIGDVAPSTQVKLLRALETREVTPVGSTRPIAVDVRVISATHRDLERLVAEGRFREDLYYRLAVFPLELPPLRERPGDIALLAEHFLAQYAGELGKRFSGFDPVALARLDAYAWPGNVRQLQNEIHRAAVLADDGGMLPAEVLSAQVAGLEQFPAHTDDLKEVMSRLEEQYIRRVLREHGDNRTHTAKALGISRQALTEKLRRYGLVDVRA
jgi:two-component system, NtrC family, response regulator HydG